MHNLENGDAEYAAKLAQFYRIFQVFLSAYILPARMWTCFGECSFIFPEENFIDIMTKNKFRFYLILMGT